MDALLDLLGTAVASPWFYLALFAVAAIDGFFPVVPSESLVITAGVYAVSGQPDPFAVVAVAALGAFVGDHISFLMGRAGGGRLARWLRPGTRRHRAVEWAKATLAERGGLILVVARYVPGGRTAVTMTMGLTGYRARSFTFFATIAAISWAVYGTVLGYVGGAAFEHDPIRGLALGLGLAIGVTVVVEAVRWWRARRRRAAGAQDTGSADIADETSATDQRDDQAALTPANMTSSTKS
ncbi:DedA family protein [Actinomadura kijaniata]|uniref:DedA family protein n=1 Tax=Actinomadura kijaniata TaxID=46161 RepID=UPI000A076D5D|nr:DedA family protein [Actinomadura kijaniata]